MSTHIKKEGALEKQSRFVKVWKKRWTVLQEHPEDNKHYLYTYEKESECTKPTEAISIDEGTEIQAKKDTDKEKNIFCIENKKDKEIFLFKAQSSLDRNEWIKAINDARKSQTPPNYKPEESKINSVMTNERMDFSPVKQLLDKHNLGMYYSKFIEEGYDQVEDFADLDVETLKNDIGMKAGHARRFIKNMKNEKQNKESEEEKQPEEKKQPEDSYYSTRKKFDLKGVHGVDKLDAIKVGKRHRTIMVIGATGTGKTALLNSMMNYLWQVEYNDPYRFKLVYETLKKGGQAESVTDNVTAYHLDPPALGYQLTVIDTPGFGDTRGLEQDQEITRKIKTFFEKEIQEIDAICFVIRAPQARLTATQKYIFAQVLGIFGKDIANNILILMTFSDGKKPPALEALEVGNVPFKESFKLNNSGFDLPDNGDDDDEFTKMYWKMGIKSFEKLFDSIDELQPKSLTLTKQVLTRREELETYIESVQPTIQGGFNVLETLRQQINIIEQFGDKINSNKNFTYKVPVTKTEKQQTTKNTTTCLSCNYTCHKKCSRSNNSEKKECRVMTRSTGNCTVCPSRCSWTVHKNEPYVYKWYTVIETRTYEDLKKKYYDANNAKSAKEQLMAKTVTELAVVEQDLNGLINNVRKCLNELADIALRPSVLSQDDYIDKLIQSEEAERKAGWQNRVKALTELKEKQDMLSKVNNDKYDPWKQYKDVQLFIQNNKNVKRQVKKTKNSGGLFSKFWK